LDFSLFIFSLNAKIAMLHMLLRRLLMRKMTKGEMTKERIYQSAKELFYSQGYNATTIQQIADRSDTTLGSMTYHFATKDTFIAKIFDDYLISIHEALKEK